MSSEFQNRIGMKGSGRCILSGNVRDVEEFILRSITMLSEYRLFSIVW
jgi:hypothetical protein